MPLNRLLLLLGLIFTVVVTTACAPLPSQRTPDNGRPEGVPANWPCVRFHLESHDRDDFESVKVFTMYLRGNAVNPELTGAFEEPDTGTIYPWRNQDGSVSTIKLKKSTPYGAPICYPPGEVIHFTIHVEFEGAWGDTVILYWETLDKQEIRTTRVYGTVLDIPRDLTGALGMTSFLSEYNTGTGLGNGG